MLLANRLGGRASPPPIRAALETRAAQIADLALISRKFGNCERPIYGMVMRQLPWSAAACSYRESCFRYVRYEDS